MADALSETKCSKKFSFLYFRLLNLKCTKIACKLLFYEEKKIGCSCVVLWMLKNMTIFRIADCVTLLSH